MLQACWITVVHVAQCWLEWFQAVQDSVAEGTWKAQVTRSWCLLGAVGVRGCPKVISMKNTGYREARTHNPILITPKHMKQKHSLYQPPSGVTVQMISHVNHRGSLRELFWYQNDNDLTHRHVSKALNQTECATQCIFPFTGAPRNSGLL